MLQEMKRFGQWVVGFALPPTCQCCGVLLRYDEPIGVCPDCWPTLPRWDVKQVPVPKLPAGLDGLAAPFVYEAPVNHWVTGLKFHDQTHLAGMLAGFMAPLCVKGEDVLLVPVPLHPSRLRGRLYNQSALLTQEVAKVTGVPWAAEGLKRVVKTPPQVKKTRRQRLQLSAKVFTAEKEVVYGKRVVLVDDIFTTGATLGACAKVLKKAGASEVVGLTVAYVAP